MYQTVLAIQHYETSVPELLASGWDMLALDDNNCSYLELALLGGQLGAAADLLAYGAPWVIDGHDAAIGALESDFPVRMLNFVKTTGYPIAGVAGSMNLLHAAVLRSCFIGVKWLMDNGADPLCKDDEGLTVFALMDRQCKKIAENLAPQMEPDMIKAALRHNTQTLDTCRNIIECPEEYSIVGGLRLVYSKSGAEVA